MRVNANFSLILGALFALVLTTTYAHPEVFAEYLGTGSTLETLGLSPLKDATDRDARALSFVRENSDALRLIAIDVLEGRRDLLEAAACFRMLKVRRQKVTHVTGPAASQDPANLCADVVAWVKAEAGVRRSGEPRKVLERLRMQLRALESNPHAIKLPRVTSQALPLCARCSSL